MLLNAPGRAVRVKRQMHSEVGWHEYSNIHANFIIYLLINIGWGLRISLEREISYGK